MKTYRALVRSGSRRRNRTYSILPTERLGTLRRTSGGSVVLLLDAVLVLEPRLVVDVAVAEPLEPTAEGLTLEELVAETSALVHVDEADWAVENESREPKAKRNPQGCILTRNSSELTTHSPPLGNKSECGSRRSACEKKGRFSRVGVVELSLEEFPRMEKVRNGNVRDDLWTDVGETGGGGALGG